MSDPFLPERAVLFRCPVDAVTMEEAVDWVDRRIAEGTACRVGAVNAAKLVKIEKDPDLARVVTACELIIADGMGVVWASPFLCGRRLRRVAGIDLMEALVARAEEKGHRVYFLGARPQVLDRMLERLRERHPALVVAGSHHGYFRCEEEPEIVEKIRRSSPHLVFVGMGTPAKELWIDRNYAKVGPAVSMGVGGSFDVLAGVVQRAPRWMQRLGMEWLFRLLQEPRRLWRRYLSTNVVFLARVMARVLARPFSRRGKP